MLRQRYITAALIFSSLFRFSCSFSFSRLSYSNLTWREEYHKNTPFFPCSLFSTLIKMRIIFHLVRINEYLALAAKTLRSNMKYKMKRKKFHFDRVRGSQNTYKGPSKEPGEKLFAVTAIVENKFSPASMAMAKLIVPFHSTRPSALAFAFATRTA